MAENTKIEWCHHTWNPWRGCTKVSPGCANCYAETQSKRNPGTLGIWGPNGTRVVASEPMWAEPLKWNRAYDQALRGFHERPYTPRPDRPRVFCASMADVFEDWPHTMVSHTGERLDITMDDVRLRLFRLMADTPHLDWLLLTKRPSNVNQMLDRIADKVDSYEAERLSQLWMKSVWLGTSVENQQAADERIPELLKCPAAVRFLSCEPLLGQLDFSHARRRSYDLDVPGWFVLSGIDWVIVGGESGPKARPMRIEWARSIVRQCKAVGVPVFVKQMGARVIDRNDQACHDPDNAASWPDSLDVIQNVRHNIHGFREEYQGADVLIHLNDRTGGDMAEWPADLRVREFPASRG